MSHKFYAHLKTVNGVDNVVCGFAICDESCKNPNPSLYTELEVGEPEPDHKLYAGKQWNFETKTFSEESFLPVYKTEVEVEIKPATDEFNKWKDIHATAVENGMPDAVLEGLVAKKDEASEKLQDILNQWDDAE